MRAIFLLDLEKGANHSTLSDEASPRPDPQQTLTWEDREDRQFIKETIGRIERLILELQTTLHSVASVPSDSVTNSLEVLQASVESLRDECKLNYSASEGDPERQQRSLESPVRSQVRKTLADELERPVTDSENPSKWLFILAMAIICTACVFSGYRGYTRAANPTELRLKNEMHHASATDPISDIWSSYVRNSTAA